MAVTGSGTSEDPYIVTTYADLVSKASETDKYIKIANDIDVAVEYPNNNVPLLSVKSYIDGDGHYVKNLYRKGSGALINISHPRTISNVHFTNIYKMSESGSYTSNASVFYPTSTASNSDSGFYNCEFRGVISSGVFLYSSGYKGNLFNQCNIKLLIKNNGCFFNVSNSASYRSPKFISSRIDIKTQDADAELFKLSGSNSATVDLGGDSYYTIDMPNFYDGTSCTLCNFDNCVFDITTQSSTAFDIPSTSVSKSIANQTHAPNVTFRGKVNGVADEYWLDAEYLDSIGFNIIYEPE